MKKDFVCPNCKGQLQISLRKQVVGNNCNCGFPNRNQITWRYLFKNWLYWKIYSIVFKAKIIIKH